MALPFFYSSSLNPLDTEMVLDEDNSRHAVQVLRLAAGGSLLLTDGKGTLVTAVIIDDHKKKCRVRVQGISNHPAPKKKVTLAISPVKNASRFEWLLEKATEIGVSAIIPLLCERTERQHIRQDRLQNILVSAMLQSQQTWLPDLREPVLFDHLVSVSRPGTEKAGPANEMPAQQRFIAHCLEAPRPTASLAAHIQEQPSPGPQLILIGPEGDFSPKEVELAIKEGFLPVTLGENRLRTETAGLVAVTLLCVG
jgi:16S rRNA (uracil1498-N3)-methyltransferase